MNVEDELMHSFFKEEDIEGLSHTQFQMGMMVLIEQGLIEVSEVNGKRMYRPTMMAKKIKTHLHSEPRTRN
jgi:predicted transcriptional regulator with HTH domain